MDAASFEDVLLYFEIKGLSGWHNFKVLKSYKKIKFVAE